jgi:hypothetical protein
MEYGKFKSIFGEEIKLIAKCSHHCHQVSLSKYCSGGDELHMSHFNQKLIFQFVDNSKPLYYKELKISDNGEHTVVDKQLKEKISGIVYDYPYLETTTPAKLMAEYRDIGDIVPTGNFILMEKHTSSRPHFEEVERILYEVLWKIKIIT